jgi:hypothetical protein
MNYISVTFGASATASVILGDFSAYAPAALACRTENPPQLNKIRKGHGISSVYQAFHGENVQPASDLSSLGGDSACLSSDSIRAKRLSACMRGLWRVGHRRGCAVHLGTRSTMPTGHTPAVFRRKS